MPHGFMTSDLDLGASTHRWWEQPYFLLAIVLSSAIPLLWPQVPPLVDLPGHIGRYRVELDLNSSADLQRYYGFRWALIGNLGVDLLVVPLAPFLGLEPAVKLIVASIPPLTVLGIFAVARQVHGRVPPTALFAIPFVYGYPFHYGFVNFALSVALALLSFALWLRLSGRTRLRSIVFAPLACALWVVHVFGWGFLGLLAFSAEMLRLRDQGRSWLVAAALAALAMLPLSIPFAFMVLWRSGDVGGETKTFFLLAWKLLSIISALRDRWLLWDAFGVAVALILVGAGLFDRRLQFSRTIGLPAAALLIAFLALPYVFFGSAHADMRLAPYVIMLSLLAVHLREPDFRLEALLAKIGLAFVICRILGNTVSFAIAGSEARDMSKALDHVPRGAAVLTLASGHCEEPWEVPRHWHLGALVISRRYGFSNDQWRLPGAQLLSVRHEAAAPFEDVDSALVFSPECAAYLNRRRVGQSLRTTQQSLDAFPRAAFDYVWLIKPPPGRFVASTDLKETWRGRDSILYRVDPSSKQPVSPVQTDRAPVR